MSDASSSILFMPVSRPAPQAPVIPSRSESYSQSRAESESIGVYEYIAPPHFINPQSPSSGPSSRSRFDVHVRSHSVSRPTVVRSARVNLAALHRLYANGVEQAERRREWSEAEQRKRDESSSSGCTFAPEISAYAQALQRPRELSPENRFRLEVDSKEHNLAVQRARLETQAMEECTFRPLTLSAARVDPSSYVRRTDRHSMLFEDAAQREIVRAKLATMMEGALSADKQEKALVLEEEREIVARLSQPQSKPEASRVSFAPIISSESERIVRSARARDPSPQSVVERLFQKYPQHQSETVVAGFTFSPAINPESIALLEQKRLEGLAKLFYSLSGGQGESRVLDLARGAVETQPLGRAEEVVLVLQAAASEVITVDDFIDLCLLPKFNALSLHQLKMRSAEDRRRSKQNNINNNNKFDEPTYRPALDLNSEKIAQNKNANGRDGGRLRVVSAESESYPFKPTINPLPRYIIDQQREAVKRASNKSRGGVSSMVDGIEAYLDHVHPEVPGQAGPINWHQSSVSGRQMNHERDTSVELLAQELSAVATGLRLGTSTGSREVHGSPNPHGSVPSARSESPSDDAMLGLLRRRRGAGN